MHKARRLGTNQGLEAVDMPCVIVCSCCCTQGGVVFAYDLNVDAPGAHEQLAWTYPLPEGPRCGGVSANAC